MALVLVRESPMDLELAKELLTISEQVSNNDDTDVYNDDDYDDDYDDKVREHLTTSALERDHSERRVGRRGCRITSELEDRATVIDRDEPY